MSSNVRRAAAGQRARSTGNSSARDTRKSSSRRPASIAFPFGGSRRWIVRSAAEGGFHGPQAGRRETIKADAPKPFQFTLEPLICGIPLKLAVYCENCETISNPRPQRCGVCDSEAVLRVEPVLNRDPDPPAHAAHRLEALSRSGSRCVSRCPFRFTCDQPPRRIIMMSSACRRPGTSPSFWRRYHNSHRASPPAAHRRSLPGSCVNQGFMAMIAEYEKTKKPWQPISSASTGSATISNGKRYVSPHKIRETKPTLAVVNLCSLRLTEQQATGLPMAGREPRFSQKAEPAPAAGGSTPSNFSGKSATRRGFLLHPSHISVAIPLLGIQASNPRKPGRRLGRD